MKIARLHPAYVWDCDNCGKENLARQMVTGNGDVLAPDLIACWNCKVVYKTDLPDLEEDDEEEDDG